MMTPTAGDLTEIHASGAVCPVRLESHRLWSLWDIMRLFNVEEITDHLLHLAEEEARYERIEMLGRSDETVDKGDWNFLLKQFRELEDIAAKSRFRSAFACMDAVNGRVDARFPPDVSRIQAELRHIRDMFVNDISLCSFLMVPESMATDVDNDALFGETVATAFPSAAADLREAGNCLAADCNTAAVFHLMRAVEWALRALGVHLGFRQLRAQKKSGVRKYVPVSHLEWEKIIDQLQGKVDKRVEKMRPGRRKQGIQEFYYPVLQDIRAIRDAWRNHVMHSRAQYSAGDAMAIKGHVERLMVKLSGRVSEV
jgi:hypothetical protein